MTIDAIDSRARRNWVNGRVVLIVLGLAALICASVILADQLAPRHRHVAAPAKAIGAGQ